MRMVYARRRQRGMRPLPATPPEVRLGGVRAGFCAVAQLPDATDEAAIISAARARSIGLRGMSAYRSSGATRPAQLVLGFGNLSETAIERGIAAIGDLLRSEGGS